MMQLHLFPNVNLIPYVMMAGTLSPVGGLQI